MTPEMEFDILNTNVAGPLRILGWALPLLKPGSQIIHINSVAGRNLAPDEAIYSASKHAMAGFLRAFRFEARAKGIRVLDVFPGAIATPMCEGRPGFDRMMSPREVARTIHDITRYDTRATLQIEELHLGRMLP
jgi:NAD(P)-dependent dehydrogenase (short-subunit alcohol dehydrogenase family)